MTKIKPPQTPFDDEISLLDIIQFFKTNFKRILFFVITGGILGALYGKFAGPVYKGSMLIAPAQVAGNYVIDSNITLTKLSMNSHYSKETFLACNPSFYKDKDKDKDIDYDMSNIVKATLSKDGTLINLSMSNKSKDVIVNCLSATENDIKLSQAAFAARLIEMKKNELQLAQNKLQLSEDFKQKLDKQLKDLKINEPQSANYLFFINVILNNAAEIKALMDQINKMTTDLSSEQTKEAGKVLPINIMRKSFPSPRVGILLGFFLGGLLGLLISLIKKINLN